MTSNRPWFVIAGGGTGGHLYPGLAVAEALRAIQPDFEVSVFGTTRPIDEKLTTPRGYELVRQEVQAFPAKLWHWPRFLKAWRSSVTYAGHRFENRAPAVVLGLGGYAAGPPIAAATKLGIPTAIFNPDAMPGRANRRLSPKVDCVFVQWDATLEQFKTAREVKVTGCPIRPEFGKAKRKSGAAALKISADRPTLLVTGASQGARSINAAMLELCDLWRVAADWQIVHLTGEADKKMCEEGYREKGVVARVLAYTEHMALCMAAADLIVSRAGASTLAEITAMGLPSVLLPYPFDRKKHQLANAKVLADGGAAVIVNDVNNPKANASALREVLAGLMKSPQRRERMGRAAAAMGRHEAAQDIAEYLLEMARRAAL